MARPPIAGKTNTPIGDLEQPSTEGKEDRPESAPFTAGDPSGGLLAALLNHTDDYILICDAAGMPRYFNQAYAALMHEALGIDMKPGTVPHEFLEDPGDVQFWRGLRKRALAGERFLVEYTHRFSEDDRRTYELSFSPILHAGRVDGFIQLTRDVTGRRLAEKALKASEERFRRLFENIIIGIFQATMDGSIFYANPAFATMFGFASPKELVDAVGEAASRLFARPEDQAKLFKRICASETPFAAEVNLARRDGGIFVGNFRGWKVADAAHGRTYIEGFVEDITEHKLAEVSLQESHGRLQFLSARLLTAQENEQRRISLEIHDVLGQDLALLKMQSIAIANRLRKDQNTLRTDIDGMLAVIDGIIERARNLSRDLNPAIIEDLKLSGALRWLVHDFGAHYDITVTLNLEPADHLFSTESQILIYRIVQEALKNIVRHAHADAAVVTLKKHVNAVLLEIEDNGVGFDTTSVWKRHVAERGLGLAAMDERGRMLGGRLEISSTPEAGTRLTLMIPTHRPRG
jgi:PAS domain S-box-containing protein